MFLSLQIFYLGLENAGVGGPHFIGHMIEKSKMYGVDIKSKRKTLVLAFLVPKPLGSIQFTSILFFFQPSAGPPAHVLTLPSIHQSPHSEVTETVSGLPGATP